MPVVGYIHYTPADLKLPIKFTQKAGKFFCVFGNVQYEDANMDALRTIVLNAIKATYTLTWTPVILIQYKGVPLTPRTSQRGDTCSYATPSLALVFERKYIGFHPDLGYKACNWEVTTERRSTGCYHFQWKGVFELPTQQETYEGTTFYHVYSNEVWKALMELQQYIDLASRKIGTHLSDASAILALLQSCHHLFEQTQSSTLGQGT